MNQLYFQDIVPDRKRIGGYYYSACPFHKGEVPTLITKDDSFVCLVCGAKGDTVDYLSRRLHVSREDVLRDYGLIPKEEDQKRTYELLWNAQQYFEYRLKSLKGEEARKYLAERQLSEETAKAFHLGLSCTYGAHLFEKLRNNGFSEEECEDSGLFFRDRDGKIRDRFYDRLMFPIHNEYGDVIGFGGRIMDPKKIAAKYVNSPESEVFQKRKNLYALDIAKASKHGFLILCEGYMDVISMHQAGFTNTVASLGTALTPEQCNLLKAHTNRVILMYDSDDAGVNSSIKAVRLLREAELQVRVASYQGLGKDPDEVIKTKGSRAIAECLKKSETGTSFLLRHSTPKEAVELLLKS